MPPLLGTVPSRERARRYGSRRLADSPRSVVNQGRLQSGVKLAQARRTPLHARPSPSEGRRPARARDHETRMTIRCGYAPSRASSARSHSPRRGRSPRTGRRGREVRCQPQRFELADYLLPSCRSSTSIGSSKFVSADLRLWTAGRRECADERGAAVPSAASRQNVTPVRTTAAFNQEKL